MVAQCSSIYCPINRWLSLSNECWIHISLRGWSWEVAVLQPWENRWTQHTGEDKQVLMMIPSGTDVNTSFLKCVQKTIPKFTADRNVLNLIARMLPTIWNTTDLMASSVLKQCGTNDEAMESTIIHKLLAIVITVPRWISILYVRTWCCQSPISDSDHPSRAQCHL